MSDDTRTALVERLAELKREYDLAAPGDCALIAFNAIQLADKTLREAADQLAVNEHEYQLIAAAVGERGMTDASTPLYIRVQNLVEHWDKPAAPVGEQEKKR